jgi:hypothetical protein
MRLAGLILASFTVIVFVVFATYILSVAIKSRVEQFLDSLEGEGKYEDF